MASPFQGMDPYIEACGLWEDFHYALVYEIKSSLTQVVPDRYLVRTGERSYVALVESGGKIDHPFLPDVSVTTRRGRKKMSKKGGSALAEPATRVEPVTMRAFNEEEHREAFVDIYAADPKQRLITSVEVLSPSNKRPGTPGWELYQCKRQSHLLGGVHLVEVDLLRQGERMPMVDPWPAGPYTLLVARANRAGLCDVWPVDFQRPLPPIPVPLAKPDPDVPLSLQPLIDAIYQRFHYERSTDYTRSLTPPLSLEESALVKQQLRARIARTQ